MSNMSVKVITTNNLSSGFTFSNQQLTYDIKNACYTTPAGQLLPYRAYYPIERSAMYGTKHPLYGDAERPYARITAAFKYTGEFYLVGLYTINGNSGVTAPLLTLADLIEVNVTSNIVTLKKAVNYISSGYNAGKEAIIRYKRISNTNVAVIEHLYSEKNEAYAVGFRYVKKVAVKELTLSIITLEEVKNL